MELSEKIKNIAFGISIIFLLNLFLYNASQLIHIDKIYKLICCDIIGVSSFLLGLFKFHNGLSLGLIIGGITTTVLSLIWFDVHLKEHLQFFISLIILLALCTAIYKLYKKTNN